MKKDEKKVKKAEDVKKAVNPEEQGVKLTDEELSQVTGGKEQMPPNNEGTGSTFSGTTSASGNK